MFVSQVIVNGTPVGSSGNRAKIWWIICGICFAIFLLMIVIEDASNGETGGETYEDCMRYAFTEDEVERCENLEFEHPVNNSGAAFAIPGMMSCCFSLIAGIIALSQGSKKQTVIIQQTPQTYYPQQQVVQRVVQQPVRQQPQGQMPTQRKITTQEQMPTQTSNNQKFAQQAKNLEMARDFKGAAEMYQKAGLFAEAGRVRQEFLEKDDKPVVQIGQVGNSVVKDSVIMGSTPQQNICKNCNSSIQADWKFCPTCNAPI